MKPYGLKWTNSLTIVTEEEMPMCYIDKRLEDRGQLDACHHGPSGRVKYLSATMEVDFMKGITGYRGP